jgi:hypothetical protein
VHNVLDACISITRGGGPGIREFFGPVKWHRADWRVPLGAQKTRVMHASKTLCTGLYKS